MAIQLVGRKVVVFEGTASGYHDISLTDLADGLASSPSEGDLVLAGNAEATNAANSTISIRDTSNVAYGTIADLFGNNARDINLHVGAKFMGATPDTTVRVGVSGSTSYAQAFAIEVWRGVNASPYLDVTSVTGTSFTGRPNPAPLTPSTDGAVIVMFAAASANGTISDLTSSDYDAFLADHMDDTYACAIAVGHKAWTSGAFDAAQLGGGSSSGSDSGAHVTLALRPAPTPIEGDAAITLGAVSVSAAGDVIVKGAASESIGDFTLDSAGEVSITGQASVSIGEVTIAAAGEIVGNDIDVTLDPITLSASGTVDIAGAADVSLGEITGEASGEVPITGAASPSLGDIGLSAAGTVPIEGAAASDIGDVGISAAGTVEVAGTLAGTLGAVTLTAAGGDFIAAVPPPDRTLALANSQLAGRTLSLDGSDLADRTLELGASRLAQRTLALVE